MLRVAIAGAGTAGPAAALLLARDGHRVELFEAFAEPLPLGAGILLQPTGLAVLGALGVRAEVEAAGARVVRAEGRTSTGRAVLDVRYADLEPGLSGLGLHRGALFRALFAPLEGAGVALRLGTPVERLDGDGLLAGGRRHGPYDLVVVADGARSRLRAQTGLRARARRYPYGAVWAIAAAEAGPPETLWQQMRGTHEMVGTLPTGRSAGGFADRTDAAFGAEGRPMTSMFWSVRNDQAPAFLRQSHAQLRERAARLGAHLETLVDRLDGTLTHATYWDVRMPAYHSGRAVVLGDAAHAMSPQLGQGANLALLDAWTLARCLRDLPVEDALAAYTRARRTHLRFYGYASRWMTPWFQSGHEVLAPPRDALFGPLTRVPPARRLTAHLLSGSMLLRARP